MAYCFHNTETKELILKTIKKLHQVMIKNRITNSILQRDNDKENASKIVEEYEQNQSDFIISISKSWFRDNSVTEALNSWTKE